MPVATIGLFALAIVVVALAFAIQQMVGGDGGDDPTPADTVATAAALNRTRTAQAGGEQTPPPQTQTTQQPNGTRTPGTTQTPGTTRTPGTGTPGTGGRTYTVQPGDNCGSIAAEFGVTIQALIQANQPDINAECTNLQAGASIKIP